LLYIQTPLLHESRTCMNMPESLCWA